MKNYCYALLAISCSLAYFSSIFAFNEPTLLYIVAVGIGSVSPIVGTKSYCRTKENPIILWLLKINEYVIYPLFRSLTRSHAPYRNGYLLNVISIAIIGIIWFIIFRFLQFIIPSTYDPVLCGYMVIFGGCVTTIFYCGTRDGAWPFYPVLKRKYCGRFDNAYPTQIFYLLLISGFLLYASYLLHLLSSDIVQIAIIFVYIGYTIFAGTLYPRGAYFRTKSSLSSFLSILFHLGAVLCFILACIFLFQLAISPLSGYLSQFPTIYTFISLIISSITQFPLCSFVLSIHSQLQSHLSFFGLSGIWWSFILMMDLGVIFFYIEKKFSSYSYYGLLHSRSFSIMASVSVVITIIAIVASCIIMGLNYLPENMPDGNQDSSKTQWVTDYSKTSPVNKRVFQNQPEHNENRDTSVVNSGHVESLLASMTNQQRSQAGIPQLSYDGGLAGLAKSRSENMAGRRTVDHQGLPEGVGENCAMNYVSGSDEAIAQAIMSQWIGSPGHRNNILDQRYTRFGLGVTVSGEYVYAVQDFQF